MSVMLPISTSELEKSFIYNTFFGAFKIITKAWEKDGTPVELSTDSTFGQIMINASEKDIYRGWETNYFNEIEDFQTPKGLITKAEQQYWITKLPAVLFMQIQRVCYDKKKKCPVKNNTLEIALIPRHSTFLKIYLKGNNIEFSNIISDPIVLSLIKIFTQIIFSIS